MVKWSWIHRVFDGGREDVAHTPHAMALENRLVQLAPIDAVVCEAGTREWAVVQAMRGKRVGHRNERADDSLPHMTSEILETHGGITGWYELPAPWVPKRGDRVRWYRGVDSGTGTYAYECKHGYVVYVGGSNVGMAVERVERLEVEP